MKEKYCYLPWQWLSFIAEKSGQIMHKKVYNTKVPEKLALNVTNLHLSYVWNECKNM